MQNYPKHIKKQLRKLSGKVYQLDLDAALSELHQQFAAWQQNKIDCWELEDAIHKFHDGISRDLYKSHVMYANYGLLVAAALNRGILRREEIADDVYQAIEPLTILIATPSK